MGAYFWLLNGRSDHWTALICPGSSTAATVSVGHTLKRPSVSSDGGSIRLKRLAISGPSTVESVYRPHTPYAVSTSASPSVSIAASRSLYFWILPVTVIGNSSTT